MYEIFEYNKENNFNYSLLELYLCNMYFHKISILGFISTCFLFFEHTNARLL